LRYFVTVTGDEAIDTGIQYVSRSTRSGRETVEANYMALRLGDRFLLVKAPTTATLTTYTGAISSLSSLEQREVMDELKSNLPELKDAFLPYILDAHGFRFGGYVGLVIGIPALLWCGFSAIRALQRSADPAQHPIARSLARFGQPQFVIGEIENELLSPRLSMQPLFITANWLVNANPTQVQATRLSDIIWIYKQVTQRRVNGVPTGKTYATHVCDSHGTQLIIPAKNEQAADQVLAAVYQTAPWVLAGYNAEIAQAWKKDRASLVAAVAQRRQQLAQA
jgi:hypothetical protein